MTFTVSDIARAREQLGTHVVETPVWPWQGVFLKLELFQRGGSFKTRGALISTLGLEKAALAAGLTTVSAGSHAIAVAHAARVVGTTAKVVVPRTANRARIERCRTLGAEVELVEDIHAAFVRVREIETAEGRTFVHPFEGPAMALGGATLGLELARQVPDLDAVIVPIGGGGLCAGVSTALKLLRPACQVFGVEPTGADTMRRSLIAGRPQSLDRVATIADSLGAPRAEPYSFALCQRHLDDVVLVDDESIRRAMRLLFSDAKLVVEPAGAAALAALRGPLRERVQGKRVAVIVSGSNIDLATFSAHVGMTEGAQERA